jgi:hypothetical protein
MTCRSRIRLKAKIQSRKWRSDCSSVPARRAKIEAAKNINHPLRLVPPILCVHKRANRKLAAFKLPHNARCSCADAWIRNQRQRTERRLHTQVVSVRSAFTGGIDDRIFCVAINSSR